MRPIVTDGVAWSVSLFVTIMSPAETAEPTEMPFGLSTRVSPRKHALNEDAHWRNLTNTIEPLMYGGDAAYLSNYFDYLSGIRYVLHAYATNGVRQRTVRISVLHF